MEYHNIFAREQLLELVGDIQVQRANVKRSKHDDEFDLEYKDGARKAFTVAIELIYVRIEQLQNQKNKTRC